MTYDAVMKESRYWFGEMEHERWYYDDNCKEHYLHRDYQRIRRAFAAWERASRLSAMLYALARTMQPTGVVR